MATKRLSSAKGRNRSSNKAAAAEKRKLILDAAVKVFARKGYYGCRVSDIAEEAKIAYGLVYHYFKSKEDVLNSIFRERWGVFVELLKWLEQQDMPLSDKLSRIVGAVLEGYRLNSEMMEVVVMEIARNSKFFDETNVEPVKQAIGCIEGMIRREIEAGHIRPGVEPRVAAYTFFSNVEALMTGSVLGAFVVSNADEQNRLRDQVVDMFLHGISPEDAA